MADNRKFVAVRRTTLQTSITATDTSMTVAAIQDIDGNTLTMSDFGSEGYAVLEPKSTSKREIIKFTAISSNTLTIERGGSPKSPYTFSGTGKSHRAGVQVILYTNAPQLYDSFANKENDETINGAWTFDGDIPRVGTYAAPTANEELAPKKYVDDVALAGAPDATEGVKGVVELATAAELAAGTATGGTSANLVPHAEDFNDTSSAAVIVPVTGSDGKLDQGFLDLTENFTFSGEIDIDTPSNFELGGVAFTGTMAQLNAAAAYVADGNDQSIRFDQAIGEEIGQGDCVAIESDGNAYPTRWTAFGAENSDSAVDASNISDTLNCSSFGFRTGDPTDLAFLFKRSGAGIILAQVVYDAAQSAYSSDTVTALTFTGTPTELDAIQLSDNKLAVLADSDEVKAIDSINGSISQGTAVAIPTGAGSTAIAKHDSSTFIVFTGTASTTGIQSHKCTVSGTTVNVESAQTFLSTGNDVQDIRGAQRFGTTDYYLVTYTDATAGEHRMIIGEWNSSTGAWTTVGTPVQIATSISKFGRIEPTRDADNKLVYVWVNSSTEYAAIINRSTTTPSVLDQISISQRDHTPSLTRVGNDTYMLGNTNSSVGQGTIDFVRVDADVTNLTAVDSQAVTSADDKTVMVAPISPVRIAALYDDGTNMDTRTIEMTNNFDGFVGVATESVTSGNVTILSDGISDDVTGLTAGTRYYVGVDGQLQTESVDSPPEVGVATGSSEILVK